MASFLKTAIKVIFWLIVVAVALFVVFVFYDDISTMMLWLAPIGILGATVHFFETNFNAIRDRQIALEGQINGLEATLQRCIASLDRRTRRAGIGVTRCPRYFAMAGLVPAIHVLLRGGATRKT